MIVIELVHGIYKARTSITGGEPLNVWGEFGTWKFKMDSLPQSPAAGQVKSISALGSYMVAFRGQDGKALESWGRLDGGFHFIAGIAGPGNPPNLGREAPNWMVQLHHFLWQHMYFGGIPMYCVRDVRLLVMLSDGGGELWWGWWWTDELMPIWMILRSAVATKALLSDHFAGTWLPNPSACSDGNRVAPIGESQPQEGERGCFRWAADSPAPRGLLFLSTDRKPCS